MINGLPNEVIVCYPKTNWSLLGLCHQVVVNAHGSMEDIRVPGHWREQES